MINAIDTSTVSVLDTPTAAFAGLQSRAASMNMDQINKTSQDFEAVFIGQMVQQMFGESVGNEAFGSEETSDIYKSMMMNEFGKQIAKSGGIGIADTIKKELLKLQEI